MNVSLTPKLEEFIRGKVASGLYNNASEVVREAMRMLVKRDDLPAEAPSKDLIMAQLRGLEPVLREHGITSVALFGSVLHGTAGPDSDIDVLVDFKPDNRVSLVDMLIIKDLIAEALGHPVDLVTRDGIEPIIRDDVFSEAGVVF